MDNLIKGEQILHFIDAGSWSAMKLIFISTNKTTVENTFKFLFFWFLKWWGYKRCPQKRASAGISMPVSYLMYLSLQVSRNFSSWVGVIRSSWYKTFGCNVPERREPTLKCGWMQSVSRADPTSLVPLSLMPYLSLVFLIRSEKLLTNFFISYRWGNWKLEGRGLRCCSTQPARRHMHVKPKHIPLMPKTPPAGF